MRAMPTIRDGLTIAQDGRAENRIRAGRLSTTQCAWIAREVRPLTSNGSSGRMSSSRTGVPFFGLTEAVPPPPQPYCIVPEAMTSPWPSSARYPMEMRFPAR